MAYSPEVERWRPLVEKYFPPELVDKALYVIQGESGGNAGIRGDGGVAIGLFQIHDGTSINGRPTAEQLADPEFNIRYAAQSLGAANGSWGAWGEGTSYNGKPFGALGNNPYPGDAGGGSAGGAMGAQPTGKNYRDPALDAQYGELKDSFIAAQRSWIGAGRPASGALFDAYDDALYDLADFTDTFGHPSAADNDIDPAQQEFDNRIKMGDFEGRQADRAFQQWYDKYSLAHTNATQAIEQARVHNQDNVALQEARNKSQTPGLLPRVTDAGYIERPYSEVMKEYMGKLGVGEQAPGAGGTGGYGFPGTGYPGAGAPGQEPGRWATEGADLMAGWEAKQRPKKLDLGGELIPANTGNFTHWLGQNVVSTDQRRINPSEGVLGGRPTASSGGGNPFETIWDMGTSAGANIGGTAKSAAKKAKKWWQRGFAEGGTNIPAGDAWVGERGAEIMEVPGFGAKIVGQNGPESRFIPEGANIIPLEEAYMHHQIQAAARQGKAPARAMEMQNAQQRQNDPQLQQKVMASLQKAMATSLAANPPWTPVYGPDVPAGYTDYWAPYRQLTGVPATQAEAMAMQQPAKGGRK